MVNNYSDSMGVFAFELISTFWLSHMKGKGEQFWS